MTDLSSAPHPFDQGITLTPAGGHRFAGQSHPLWRNMVGPYGGITAATLLNAVMLHPQRLGEPVSLTVNFAGPVGDAPFHIEARPVRTNRSTQHWMVELVQPGADGQPEVATTATVFTALRRDTWGASDQPMPTVPPAEAVAPLQPPPGAVAWLSCYDMRPLAGSIPLHWDDRSEPSLSRLWVRDAPPRPLDFCALAALSDIFFPRIWLKRARRVPVGTVSMTVYFHADSALLASTGSGHLLAQAQGQAFHQGYFDHSGQLWNAQGRLLATTHQIVYFKE